MKKAIIFYICLLSFLSCKKNKEYCWKCYFTATDTRPGLDTSLCNLTSDEAKAFQQDYVKMLNDKYGESENIGLSSTCHKVGEDYK